MKIKKILSKENWDKFPYFGFGIIGGIQIFNGLLLIILGIVDVLLHYRKDTVPWPKYDDWMLHRTLTAVDVPTWCGVWFMVSGSIAGCIGRGTRIITALKFTKGVFLFMSLVSALLLAPASGAAAGYIVILRHDRGYNYTELLIPVSITFLSIVQLFFACLSVGICCCCSDTKSSKGQRIVKEEIIETIPDRVEDNKRSYIDLDGTSTLKPETKTVDDVPATRQIVVVPTQSETARAISEVKEQKANSIQHCSSCPSQGSNGCCQQTYHNSHGNSHNCHHHFQNPSMASVPNVFPIIQFPPNYPNMVQQTQAQPQPILMPFPLQYPQTQDNKYSRSNQMQAIDTATDSSTRKSHKKRPPMYSPVLEKRSVKLQVPAEIEIEDDQTEKTKRPTKQLKRIPKNLQMSNIQTNTYYEEVSDRTKNNKSPDFESDEDESQSFTTNIVQDSDNGHPVTVENKLIDYNDNDNNDDDVDIIPISKVQGQFPESNRYEGVEVPHTNLDRSIKIQPEIPLRPKAVERLVASEVKSGTKENVARANDDFDVKSQTSEYSNDSYNTLKRLALPY